MWTFEMYRKQSINGKKWNIFKEDNSEMNVQGVL